MNRGQACDMRFGAVAAVWLLLAGPGQAFAAGKPFKVTGDHMTLLDKGKAVEFVGNARLESASFTVTSERMVHRDKGDVAEATGRVHLVHRTTEGNTLDAFGDHLRHEGPIQFSRLTGESVRLFWVDTVKPKESTTLDCRVLEVWHSSDQAHATGQVRIQKEKVQAEGEEAWYDDRADRLTLTGHPKAYEEDADGTATYTGDTMHLKPRAERLRIEGRAHARLEPK